MDLEVSRNNTAGMNCGSVERNYAWFATFSGMALEGSIPFGDTSKKHREQRGVFRYS